MKKAWVIVVLVLLLGAGVSFALATQDKPSGACGRDNPPAHCFDQRNVPYGDANENQR